MDTCADMICNCGQHECSCKDARDVIKPAVYDNSYPQSETSEEFQCNNSQRFKNELTGSKKYSSTSIPEKCYDNRKNGDGGDDDKGQDYVETYIAKPSPYELNPDHICEPCQPFVPQPCAKCQLRDGVPIPCKECSRIFYEYENGAKSSKPSLEDCHQKRKVRFNLDDDDHKDDEDDVDWKNCPPSKREQIPAVGESDYGDVPYLSSYQDPLCIKRELHHGHPDNLFTMGPFQGRSETSERFVNPGLPKKKPWELRKRLLEPPPFFARSVYQSEFEPPYPRKPLDIHASRMTREPEITWEKSPKVKNPHKEEYRPPPKKEPEIICVQDPPPRYLESTYNNDYICYYRDLPRASKIKDIKMDRKYAKEAIMRSHLECPYGPPDNYVCCLCLCCPPCKCPGEPIAGGPMREDSGEQPPYYETQECNVDPLRISAFCRGHDYHPPPEIRKYLCNKI